MVFDKHFKILNDRLAVEAWGLKNCTQSEEWFSDTVTAVLVPPYIDSSEIVRRAWKRYNLSLGLGLNKVAGKVFRIGHLGNLNEVRMSTTFITSNLIHAMKKTLTFKVMVALYSILHQSYIRVLSPTSFNLFLTSQS